MKKRLLIWTILLCSISVNGQTADNAVVFQKKKNPDKTFAIPFNEYSVTIKPKTGNKIRGYISDCNDSMMTVRTLATDKTVNDQILQVSRDHKLNAKDRQVKIDSLRYSNIQEIKLSEIDRIGINRWTSKGKRWIFATTYLGGISAYVLWVSYEESVNPDFSFPHPVVFVSYAGLLYLLQHKTLKLDKWAVAPEL